MCFQNCYNLIAREGSGNFMWDKMKGHPSSRSFLLPANLFTIANIATHE